VGPLYIYDTLTTSLIFISESKQWLYDSIGIHHLTLNNSILNGSLYLNRFFLSLDAIVEYSNKNILNSKEFIDLIQLVKSKHKPFQPASKKILAENIHNPKLNQTFSSIGELTKYFGFFQIRKEINLQLEIILKKNLQVYIVNNGNLH
jgi:hypothetical protein